MTTGQRVTRVTVATYDDLTGACWRLDVPTDVWHSLDADSQRVLVRGQLGVFLAGQDTDKWGEAMLRLCDSQRRKIDTLQRKIAACGKG